MKIRYRENLGDYWQELEVTFPCYPSSEEAGCFISGVLNFMDRRENHQKNEEPMKYRPPKKEQEPKKHSCQ